MWNSAHVNSLVAVACASSFVGADPVCVPAVGSTVLHEPVEQSLARFCRSVRSYKRSDATAARQSRDSPTRSPSPNSSQITDVGCHRLANSLGPLKVLSTLDLCHNPFGEKACLSLATYLSQPGCPLRSLSVAGCLDVDSAAWKTISVRGREGMGWDPPRPGDDGVVSLAAALVCPHGCPLRYAKVLGVEIVRWYVAVCVAFGGVCACR